MSLDPLRLLVLRAVHRHGGVVAAEIAAAGSSVPGPPDSATRLVTDGG